MTPITPFKKLWKALDEGKKAGLAANLDTSVGYLKLIANGHRNPSPGFAKKMWRATGIPLSKLRPDIWGKQA